MPIKWVTFDAMGVIYEVADDVSDLLVPFLRSKNNKLPLKTIYNSYIKASLGQITSLEFWKALGYGSEYPEIEKEFLDNWYIFDAEFFEVAKELRKKYKLAMLSNDLKDWSKFLRVKFKINHFFDILVISGDVGYRKPDKKIYEILLEKTKSPAEDCLFIDDKLENLRAASELRIKTIKFVRRKEKVPFCSEFEISSFKELIQVLKNFY
ncbi:MAG: HAD-IA family hydrolase [Promethearchaeota archaeon]